MQTNFDVNTFDVEEYHKILDRGLSYGVGKREGKMCIEAAICTVLKLPHGDDPGCVCYSVRTFKTHLNDSSWSSAIARAEGLRDLGLAQLGSYGVVNDREFSARIVEETIRIIIPSIFRKIFSNNKNFLTVAKNCEDNPTAESASAAAYAAYAANATSAATYATSAATYAAHAATYAATSATYAAYAAHAAGLASAYAANAADAAAAADYVADEYLKLSASLALKILRELKSPGCKLLERGK